MSSIRIGLLGGTFNPVHFGHLQLAGAAMQECNLDKVIFIPSAQPPHKNEKTIASYADRVAMLQIACEEDCRFSCTTIESNLPTPSYTIDTLRAIKDFYKEDVSLFFIIGADAFLDLLSWKSYEEILQRVTLIVARRTGYEAKKLADFMSGLRYTARGNIWEGRGGRKIIVLQSIPDKYSSTDIREKIERGIFPENEIPPGVIRYIREHSLFQINNAKMQSSACMNC